MYLSMIQASHFKLHLTSSTMFSILCICYYCISILQAILYIFLSDCTIFATKTHAFSSGYGEMAKVKPHFTA